MLVLSRKQQQEILVGDNVKITVLKVKGNTVRLGIEAPKSVRVVRGELKPVEPMATVTVVIDDNAVVNEITMAQDAKSTRDVVPFRKPKETDSRNPRLETENAPRSINFNSRLPESLKHNRLKQIVREISGKNT